jgi:chromosome segregation ATPase
VDDMTAKTISREDVFNAARELVSAGEKPSILAIHKRLGRGSNTTIAKHRALFLESDEMKDLQVANLPLVAELPREFEEEGAHFVKKIWQMAKSVSDAQLEAEREALSIKHEAMQEEVKDAVDFSDAVANERDEYQEKCEAQTVEIELSKSEITELKHALDMLKQKNEVLLSDLEKVSIDANEAKTKLASSIRETAALEQETIGLKSRLVETKSDHQEEISRLLEQAETEKNRIIEQSEKSLEKIDAQQKAVIVDLKTAQDKTVNQLIEQHNKAQEQLEATISDMRQQRDQFQKELVGLRSEHPKKKTQVTPKK